MRAWDTQAAKAVNLGKTNTPAEDAVMTTSFAKTMKNILGDDIGLYYPGPLPSQITSVTSHAPGQRIIYTCDVLQGFAENKKTHKPAKPLDVEPGEVDVLLINGVWRVDASTAGRGSCKGVKVAMTKW